MHGGGYLGIARLALFCVLHMVFPGFRAALGPKFKRGDHFLQADLSLLIATQRVHWRSCAHRDPPVQIAETK